MITSDVENYPGYPDGIMGPEMMAEFRAQAARFGAEFMTDDVTRVDFSDGRSSVFVGDEEHQAQTVIVATGATRASSGSSRSARCRAAASRTARPATAPSSRPARSSSSAAATRRWRRRSS